MRVLTVVLDCFNMRCEVTYFKMARLKFDLIQVFKWLAATCCNTNVKAVDFMFVSDSDISHINSLCCACELYRRLKRLCD